MPQVVLTAWKLCWISIRYSLSFHPFYSKWLFFHPQSHANRISIFFTASRFLYTSCGGRWYLASRRFSWAYHEIRRLIFFFRTHSGTESLSSSSRKLSSWPRPAPQVQAAAALSYRGKRLWSTRAYGLRSVTCSDPLKELTSRRGTW